MDETTRIENAPNKPMENRSAKPELSSPTATNMKALDRSQLLDTIATKLFTFLKICVFMLLLLAFIFIFIKTYTQQGVVILPFEMSKNEDLSGIAIADQLTAELMWIEKIHHIKYEEIITEVNRTHYTSDIFSEKLLGSRELIVPKSEIVEFNMVDIGNIDVGTGSLSLGKLMIAFKNICPGSKPVTTIRGSLQRYSSTIVLVALLDGSNVQSWVVRQPIDNNNNEEQILEMIKNLAFMIAHDLPQSNVSAKTWEGLKYYTEALDAYNQYELSGNLDDLYLASNYSLKALSSEKNYEKPIVLLSSLESNMMSIGRQNDATEYCKKTLELDPKSTSAWISNGTILTNQDKYGVAIQAFDEAIRLDPKSTSAWINKGYALNKQGKYGEAIQAFDEAIRLDPKSTSAWDNKGVALRNQRNYADAIRAHDEAIRLDPQYPWPWHNKGVALYYLGKYDEAIKAYEEAIRLDPNFATAWSNKGIALYYLGKYDEAIKASDEAIRLDPKYSWAWHNKGIALEALGRDTEATTALAKAKELGYAG
jgi:tetratricopeptide (TPR) repeat protein